MGSFFQRKPVRMLRTAFRWLRIVILFALFLAVASVAYLHTVGLPDFLKRPLLRTLRERGWEAQFSSARLGLRPSIIIEDAAFSPTDHAAGPRVSATRAELALNARALLHRRLHVVWFEILQARLELPVSSTNHAPLALTGADLKVTLRSNNVAQLNDSTAWFRGIHIHIQGEFRDYLAARDWKIPLPPRTAAAPAAPAATLAQPPPPLHAWDILQNIQFIETPELKVQFWADGRDLNSLRADLEFTAAGARTPWGGSDALYLRAACARLLDTNGTPLFQARLSARNVLTPWAAGQNVSMTADLWRELGTNFAAAIHLDGDEFSVLWRSSAGSNWVRLPAVQWEGTTTLPSPDFIPQAVAGQLRATNVESSWGSASALSLLVRAGGSPATAPPDPALGWWAALASLWLDWQMSATNITTAKLKLERLATEGQWRPPLLTLKSLEASMYRGRLDADGTLDAASREVQVRAAADFDPHQISPLLSAPAQHWISRYDWDSPPRISAGVRFVLPPWTNRVNNWWEDIRPGGQLAGEFSIGRGAFRGIAVTNARSHFSYTNRIWSVPDLRVAGPGGALEMEYTGNDATRGYHCHFDSRVDPAILQPLLTGPQQVALRQVNFAEKPEIRGEARGAWNAPETVGVKAIVAATNFSVRGEAIDQLNAALEYTNRFLRVSQLNLSRGPGRVQAPLAAVNFASNMTIYLTNAVSTLDPEPVRRALGKLAPPFLSVIRFDPPPRVQASGSFTPGDDSGTDLRFLIKGEHFHGHWKNLTAETISGAVDYHLRTVTVTNVQAGFCNGTLGGWISFDWTPNAHSTTFRGEFGLKDINLASLDGELRGKKSKVEGMLDGQLALASPCDGIETNLYGQGGFRVHDAMLWDIKLFGILSPMLNAIAPGAGESRARAASASFAITNGIIATEDLEIRASGFRLLYRGSVDFRQRLNARVEANLLRDTPLLGHVLSWMLTPVDKLFEYRVTGTLQKPVVHPIYIPKPFLMLLRPFHTLKELLPAPPPANSPAPPPPPQPKAAQ